MCVNWCFLSFSIICFFLSNADEICANFVSGEDLIAPCHCKGTQKHVHRSCLDNWRSTKVNARFSPTYLFPDLQSDMCGTLRIRKIMSTLQMFICNLPLHACMHVIVVIYILIQWLIPAIHFQEGFAFAHCTECRAMFILRANVPADRWWLRLKFHFLVARDHALIFIVVQLVRSPSFSY